MYPHIYIYVYIYICPYDISSIDLVKAKLVGADCDCLSNPSVEISKASTISTCNSIHHC